MIRKYGVAAAIAVLIVLIGVVFTQTHNVVDRHPEAALRADLAMMRKCISDYHAKHHRNPSSLNDLVTDGELRMIPTDPITRSRTTWKTTIEENVRVDDFQQSTTKVPPSIVDVHSGATGTDSTGRPFSDY